MKKYRLLYHNGWFFLPENIVPQWNISIDKEKEFEEYFIGIARLTNTIFYIPDDKDTVDSIFNVDAIKHEYDEVLKMVNALNNESNRSALRERIVVSVLARPSQFSLNDVDKIVKYITDGTA